MLSLDRTELQGANFGQNTDMRGASLNGAKIWHVRGQTFHDYAYVADLDREVTPWDAAKAETYTHWRSEVLADVPLGEGRKQVQESLAALDPDRRVSATDAWSGEQEHAGQGVDLAVFLARLACENGGTSPYVARALLSWRWVALAQAPSFSSALHERSCKGTQGFTSDDWAKLDNLNGFLR